MNALIQEPSGGGGSVTWVQCSTADGSITGLVNGINTVYNLPSAPAANALSLYRNGQFIDEYGGSPDFTRVGLVITLATPLAASDDKLVAKYTI